MTAPIHPKTQELIELFLSSGAPPIAEGTVEQGRETISHIPELLGPGPEVGSVRDVEISTADRAIPARIYQPEEAPIATILYLHGGGWVVGTLESYDPMARMLTKESGCKLVVVDYRLAPEHPFPAAVDDAYAALEWVAAHETEGALLIAGDSAGGNLAAVCAIRARDRGGPDLALQILIYPVTDHDFATRSYIEHGDNPLLSSADMRWFWDHYVPSAGDRADPDASPLRTDDLSGLPPAYVVVSEHDVLRDEIAAYAGRLEDAGVLVTVRHHDDQTHGFAMMVNFLPEADEAIRDVASVIRESVGVIR
jgi:acetyl esterase